jgi:ribosomal protein L40E
MSLLQQNSLLMIGALIILVIVLAAIAMSRRGRPSAPQQQVAGRVFCGKCGAENPASNEFCSSCGNKLKGT